MPSMRMIMRASWFGLVVAALAACEQQRAASEPPAAPEPAAPAASVAARQLEPWDSVDEMFSGCAGGCGLRATGPTEGVAAQPGAAIGQSTYCPVSGVVFEVKAES